MSTQRARPAAALMFLARIAVLAAFALPLFFMALGSVRGLDRPPPRGFDLVPDSPGIDPYERVAELLPLQTLVTNSLIVVGIAVPLTVVIASCAGFAISQFAPRPRRWAVGGVVALLLVPGPAVWIPRFILYRHLGALDSLVPLIAPAMAATTAFLVLLAHRSFQRLPDEIWDAARSEGASAAQTWWRVGLPLTRPTTAAVGVIAFTYHWGNYLDALLYVNSPGRRTLALGVAGLRDLDPSDAPVTLAGAFLVTAVPVIVLISFQRRLFAALE